MAVIPQNRIYKTSKRARLACRPQFANSWPRGSCKVLLLMKRGHLRCILRQRPSRGYSNAPRCLCISSWSTWLIRGYHIISCLRLPGSAEQSRNAIPAPEAHATLGQVLTLKEIWAVDSLSQLPGQMELPRAYSSSLFSANWITLQRRMSDKVSLIGRSSLASKGTYFPEWKQWDKLSKYQCLNCKRNL